MKLLAIFAIVFAAFMFSGCSTLQSVNDYIGENPAFVNLAARQAAARIITKEPTEEKKRAERLYNGVDKVLAFIKGSPVSTAGGVVNVINAEIESANLNTADKILVSDLIALLNVELSTTKLEPDSVVEIRALLETIKVTAKLYLE